MKHPRALIALYVLALSVNANAAPTPTPAKPPTAPAAGSHTPTAPTPVPAPGGPTTQDLVDILKKQQDLLDIVKNQQSLIEDIIYNQRLQRRQNVELEQRLEESLLENSQLRSKIANLEAAASVANTPQTPLVVNPPGNNTAPPNPNVPALPTPPPQPSSHLPPPPEDEGSPSWHRLFTLSGADGKNSDPFEIQGKTWRVVWYNQDKPGKAYLNTSALFISAYPKDDTIPQKVCAKLGSGGDTTELTGAGTYYLKVEASGGSWELAVEEMR